MSPRPRNRGGRGALSIESRALTNLEVLRGCNVGTDTTFRPRGLCGALENVRIVQRSLTDHDCINMRFLKASLDIQMALLPPANTTPEILADRILKQVERQDKMVLH